MEAQISSFNDLNSIVKRVDKFTKRFRYLYILIIVVPILLFMIGTTGLIGILDFFSSLGGFGYILTFIAMILFVGIATIPLILVFIWGILNSFQVIRYINKNKSEIIKYPEIDNRLKKLKRKSYLTLILLFFILLPTIVFLLLITTSIQS